MIQLHTRSVRFSVPRTYYNWLYTVCSFRAKTKRGHTHTTFLDLRGSLRTMVEGCTQGRGLSPHAQAGRRERITVWAQWEAGIHFKNKSNVNHLGIQSWLKSHRCCQEGNKLLLFHPQMWTNWWPQTDTHTHTLRQAKTFTSWTCIFSPKTPILCPQMEVNLTERFRTLWIKIRSDESAFCPFSESSCALILGRDPLISS